MITKMHILVERTDAVIECRTLVPEVPGSVLSRCIVALSKSQLLKKKKKKKKKGR